MADNTPARPVGEGAPRNLRREVYGDHEVLFPVEARDRRVFIDGVPRRYGRLTDGYYLDAYSYDRAESLEDVVKRYLDYRDAVERKSEK
jgi:hypothetical protein